jgi:hypothetical protein
VVVKLESQDTIKVSVITVGRNFCIGKFYNVCKFFVRNV